MKTTNQAFIKAFRQDAQEEPADLGATLQALQSALESVSYAVNVGQSAATSATPGEAATAASSATAEQPAAQAGQPKAPLPSPRVAASTGAKRPLSTFIPQPTRTLGGESAESRILRFDDGTTDKAPSLDEEETTAPSETESATTQQEQSSTLRPGTAVACYRWPAVCRTLVQQYGQQLDRVTRLLLARADAGDSLIGIFGLFRGSGATTAAMCLALRAAQHGKRVILADGNLINPQVASRLDAVPTAGWEEFLKHTALLPDAVIHSTDDNLDILALGEKRVKNPQSLVNGLQAAVTAGILRHTYNLAFMDLGAFFDPVSQPVLLELVTNLGIDAAIAIVGPTPADRRDLSTLTEFFDNSGCELLGTIENRIKRPRAA
ncbi:MAG: hypothetical protein IT425_00620 [Pirellulales bacterium]|nr:hypothetical protein [Pirellulales bacterium]